MKLKFKKVYMVSKKAEKPRLFLQHLICETAGFIPGEELYITVNGEKEEITVQNYPTDEIRGELYTAHVASRTSKISGKKRPLVDSSGEKYAFLDISQKIEINVYKQGTRGRIVIKPLEYNLFENTTIETPKDQRIRLLSVCAGSGIGTAALVETDFFSPIQEIELEDDSVENLLLNFPNSTVFAGNLKDCQEVAEVDVALITLPCTEHSNLGDLSRNVVHDLVIATSKIIESSKAKVLFFENVPNFYKTQAWWSLKDLLSDTYPFWVEKSIEAWDFGSIATRRRTYCIATKSEDFLNNFEFPTAPKMRRKKLKDFLDPSSVEHDWKDIDAWMESFNSREAWKNRSLELTFVTKDVEKIQCIAARYSSHCASNSYVMNEDKKRWRLLSINEIRKILGVPDWFQFSEHSQKIRKYEMLGQSVSCQVMKAIANKIAYAFMKIRKRLHNTIENEIKPVTIRQDGQLALLL